MCRSSYGPSPSALTQPSVPSERTGRKTASTLLKQSSNLIQCGANYVQMSTVVSNNPLRWVTKYPKFNITEGYSEIPCAMSDKVTLFQRTTRLSCRYFIWQLILPLPVGSYIVLTQLTQTTNHTRGGVAAEETNFSCHTEQEPCIRPLTPKSLHQTQRKLYKVFSQKFIVFIFSIKFSHQNSVSISCLAIFPLSVLPVLNDKPILRASRQHYPTLTFQSKYFVPHSVWNISNICSPLKQRHLLASLKNETAGISLLSIHGFGNYTET